MVTNRGVLLKSSSIMRNITACVRITLMVQLLPPVIVRKMRRWEVTQDGNIRPPGQALKASEVVPGVILAAPQRCGIISALFTSPGHAVRDRDSREAGQHQSYLDSIRTEEELSIYETEKVELGRGSPPKTKTEEHEPGTISLSIAQVGEQCAPGSNKLRQGILSLFTKTQRPASPLADIPTHEYLARGWDANNTKWRKVMWPALDKDFRPALREGTPPVRQIQCPWKKNSAIGTKLQPQGEENQKVWDAMTLWYQHR
ncbi:hypothetical protein B0H14DRAFT_3558372 [Mycena olivaceomarginata]|nr:hypothetical protein B0H14DRAFT_3558372 [Mycena olivaceomarginata]